MKKFLLLGAACVGFAFTGTFTGAIAMEQHATATVMVAGDVKEVQGYVLHQNSQDGKNTYVVKHPETGKMVFVTSGKGEKTKILEGAEAKAAAKAFHNAQGDVMTNVKVMHLHKDSMDAHKEGMKAHKEAMKAHKEAIKHHKEARVMVMGDSDNVTVNVDGDTVTITKADGTVETVKIPTDGMDVSGASELKGEKTVIVKSMSKEVDIDVDGDISEEEIAKILEKHGVDADSAKVEKHVVIKKIDEDGNVTVIEGDDADIEILQDGKIKGKNIIVMTSDEKVHLDDLPTPPTPPKVIVMKKGDKNMTWTSDEDVNVTVDVDSDSKHVMKKVVSISNDNGDKSTKIHMIGVDEEAAENFIKKMRNVSRRDKRKIRKVFDI